MTPRDDDPAEDALRWDDYEAAPAPRPRREVADAHAERSAEPPADPEPVALPEGYAAVGRGAEGVGIRHSDGTVDAPAETPPAAGSAMLVVLGLIGGVSLFYAAGWASAGIRLLPAADVLIEPVGYIAAVVLAALAPLLWFATVLLLTRRSAGWVRICWLVAGVVLLVPWPYLSVGGAGL